MKALIRQRGNASLSTFARRHVFAWRGQYAMDLVLTIWWLTYCFKYGSLTNLRNRHEALNVFADVSATVCFNITKTCLYNFDPLKPHFYIVKLGFVGVDIIFLISAQNIDCEYSLEPPRWGGSNEYPQSMFWGGSNEYPQSMFWAEI